MNRLDLDCERALHDDRIDGVAAVFYENERPLRGLAGLMDWRSGGLLSQCLRKGAITGRTGECAYVPLTRPDKVWHILLVGGGQLTRYGKRGLVSDEAFSALRANLLRLKLERIGISRTEFGGLNDEYFSEQLGKAPYWVLP